MRAGPDLWRSYPHDRHAINASAPRPAVLGDAIPASRVGNAALVLGGAFVGLAAQVSVPLSFTPVPLTGQTFAVLLTDAHIAALNKVSAPKLNFLAENNRPLAPSLAFAGATVDGTHTSVLPLLTSNAVRY